MPKILIVDDEADLVAVLEDRFIALGYEVITARNGAEALERSTEGPDAVILDLMMPELNGFQVCRRLKSETATASIPVIMLTAKDTEADRFWGSEVGADLYLAKPADPAQVVQHVEQLLAAAG